MKRILTLALVVVILAPLTVGCSNREFESEVLEYDVVNQINNSISEIYYNSEGVLGKSYYYETTMNMGYYDGNIYVSLYDNIYSFLTLRNKLYILKNDGTLQESDKEINEKYKFSVGENANNDYFTSNTSLYDWRNNKEIFVISEEDKAKLELNKLNSNTYIDERISMMKGTDKYAIYRVYLDDKEQFVISDLEDNKLYISDVFTIPKEHVNYLENSDKDSYSSRLFYDTDTKSIYSIDCEGVVYKNELVNGKVITSKYDSFNLNKGMKISNVEMKGKDTYIRYAILNSNYEFNKIQKIFRYDVKNKIKKDVFITDWDTQINNNNFSQGYFVVSKRVDNLNWTGMKKYYLATFDGDNIKLIKEICEDTDNVMYDPSIYIDPDKQMVVADIIVNKGSVHIFRNFELEE